MARKLEGVVFHKGRFVVQIEMERDPVTWKRRRKQATVPPCPAHEQTVQTCSKCQRLARDRRIHMMEQLAGGRLVLGDDPTLRDWSQLWFEGHRSQIGATTAQGYESKLRTLILPELGNLRLSEIDAAALEAFYARARKPNGRPYALASIQQCHAILHACFEAAVRPRGKYLNFNPVASAKTPRTRPVEDTGDLIKEAELTWSREHAREFFAAIRHRPDYFSFFFCAYALGMRRSELLGLKWDMVDFDRGVIHVRRTRKRIKRNGEAITVWEPPKTKKSRRTIEMGQTVAEVLREHRKRQMQQRLVAGPAWDDRTDQAEGCVWRREDGTLGLPTTYSSAFVQMRRQHCPDLPAISLHGLRHTHATQLLEAGRPTKEVSERLGHRSTAFTEDTYMHVTHRMRSQTASVVDDLLANI